MTCRMAAGKQKKRLINSTYSEQYRSGKKPRLHSSNCLISLKSQIGLKWDVCQKKVVPKKEQVGILWSDLAPFIESSPKHHSVLADVTYVPPETFSLENLRGVLSYEVWSTCLTEAERNFLIQFLPSEIDAEENVHSLLAGENHHFRNPCLSWSSSICCGDTHPDAVLNKEKKIRAEEKEHRINLHNYHSNMVETLKKWRKRWLSCDDPENLFRFYHAKQKQEYTRSAGTKSEFPLKVTYSTDVSKFMSYIEISGTQHNLVKGLKQSGDGIQTKHLTRVIGDLDKFHVKPYSTLMEDEQRRLHEHWLNVCNEIPAAFEVLRDRKMLIEKLRKLLGLELGEKNVPVMRKTDQLAYRTKELGKDGACRNDNSLGLQNGKVEPLAQDVMHSGDDHIPSLEDRDDGKTNYTETSINHHENLNVKDEDIMLVDGTDITSQSEKSVVQDQDQKDISCAYTGITFSANNSGEQNEDPMDLKFSNDDLDVPVEDIKNISYTDTTVNSDILESKQIKPMSYTSRHVHTLDSHNMQAEDLDGFAYSGPSIHVHEQDQGLQSIGNTIMNGVGRCVNNVPSEKCHPEMNAVIVDQEQDENIRIMPLNSSSVLSVSSREQVFVDDFLDPNDQAGKDEKYVWHLSGPLDSLYQPADNRTYSDTGGSQIKHGHLSAVQHDSAIYLQNDVLRRQQAQVTVASVLPVDNSASFVQPCSNRQSNGQLQIIAEDNGMLPSSHECRNVPKQSTDLLSVVNNRLAQFTSFSTAMEGHQLIDRSHNGRYMQQIQKNLYPGVRFPTKGNSPIVEQQSFAACRSLDRRYNLFPVDQSHNLSGLGSNNCLTQALPGGSNIDGSLFSALAQYKQPLAHLQSGGLSSSQLPEIRNQDDPAQSFVPTHDINSAVPNTYAYSQTLPTSQSSQVASLGSLNSMGWTNSIQQNPGMPNFMNRQFRGPWTR